MINKKILEEIIKHAKQECPKEACGFLVKENSKKNSIEIHKMRNIAEDPTNSYLMDPREQLALFREMNFDEDKIFAIYHSHTHTDAYPSPRDVEFAYFPNVLYLIVSLQNFDEPEIREFKISEGEIKEDEKTQTS